MKGTGIAAEIKRRPCIWPAIAIWTNFASLEQNVRKETLIYSPLNKYSVRIVNVTLDDHQKRLRLRSQIYRFYLMTSIVLTNAGPSGRAV